MSAAGLLDAVVTQFAADEGAAPAGRHGGLAVAAAGTIADAAVRNPLLDAACRSAGVRITTRSARADLAGLLAAPDWELALIISPLKREAAARCGRLAPRAAATGVVDTMIRTGGEVVGYNTNSHAWAAAAARLMGAEHPQRILVVGSGATARSVTVGALRAFPQARVGVAARSAVAAAALVGELGGGECVSDLAGFRPSLIAHVTTVGEQDDDRPLEVPLATALQPGTRVFDLTNRLSTLQRQALAAGCVTMSGNLMQLLTNTLRAALVRGWVSGHRHRGAGNPAAGGRSPQMILDRRDEHQ